MSAPKKPEVALITAMMRAAVLPFAPMNTLVEIQPQDEVRGPSASNSEETEGGQGYVGNSTGSSFVVVGISVKTNDIPGFQGLVPAFYADGLCVLDGRRDRVPNGYSIVGKDLVDGFGELEFRHIPLEKILEVVEEVKNVVNLPGEVGLFTGTRRS